MCISACNGQGGVHSLGRSNSAKTPLGRTPSPPPRDGHSSGRYASYWNAFLLEICLIMKFCLGLLSMHLHLYKYCFLDWCILLNITCCALVIIKLPLQCWIPDCHNSELMQIQGIYRCLNWLYGLPTTHPIPNETLELLMDNLDLGFSWSFASPLFQCKFSCKTSTCRSGRLIEICVWRLGCILGGYRLICNSVDTWKHSFKTWSLF